jgi:hypothetical protein
VQSDKRKALGRNIEAWKSILDVMPACKLCWVLEVDPMGF